MNKLLTILVNVCRAVIGLTFVFSGYVKAIDPLGTQYKIQDYLGALGLSGFIPDWLSLLSSIALSAIEFSLGVFVVLAMRRRIMSRAMLAFMVLMTAVTVWIAVADPVKDCGCFGDAVTLSNWETLVKNLILLTCAVVLCRWPLRMVRFVSRTNQWIAVNYTVLYILASSLYSLYTLPRFDFRPYHVGADIRAGMQIPEGAKLPKYETTFILQKDGVEKEFTLDNYPDSTWEFVDSKTVQTEEGYVPPIHDFAIQRTEDGEDITDSVLTHEGYTFLLISPHLEHADDSNFGDIDQLYEYCQAQQIPFYCLTASGSEAIRHWQDITGAEYPFCNTDETTLKTIIRSNPGLVLLKQGVVIDKWSHNKLPKAEKLTAPLDQLPIGQIAQELVAQKIATALLWFVLPLVLLTLADRTWAWSQWVRNRKRRIRKDTSTINKEEK